MEPLTAQQIDDNRDAIADAAAATRKIGLHATFSDKLAFKIDITPLPLLETSPVVPKVDALLETEASADQHHTTCPSGPPGVAFPH